MKITFLEQENDKVIVLLDLENLGSFQTLDELDEKVKDIEYGKNIELVKDDSFFIISPEYISKNVIVENDTKQLYYVIEIENIKKEDIKLKVMGEILML